MRTFSIILLLSFGFNTFAQSGRNSTPVYQDEALEVQKELKAVAKKKTQSDIEEKIRTERTKNRNPNTEESESSYLDQAEAPEETEEE